MDYFTIDHKTKARLHNILADVYNNQVHPRKFPTKPDVQEVMSLMYDLAQLPERAKEVAGIRYEHVSNKEAGGMLVVKYAGEGRVAALHVETLEVRSW